VAFFVLFFVILRVFVFNHCVALRNVEVLSERITPQNQKRTGRADFAL
jgi:hypothetical protein